MEKSAKMSDVKSKRILCCPFFRVKYSCMAIIIVIDDIFTFSVVFISQVVFFVVGEKGFPKLAPYLFSGLDTSDISMKEHYEFVYHRYLIEIFLTITFFTKVFLGIRAWCKHFRRKPYE